MKRTFVLFVVLMLVAGTPVRGEIWATNAHITGQVTATSGDVSGAINAGSITTTMLGANVVTADKIAANTITADKLNVSTLSAINANAGTITAGTITGVTVSGSTVYAGSGNEITLNNSGMSIVSGDGTGPARIVFAGSYSLWGVSGGGGLQTNGNFTVGGTADVLGAVRVSNGIYYTSPPTTTSSFYPVVHDSSTDVLRTRTDGATGTNCGSIDVEKGIVTVCTPTPNVAALLARIEQLEQEVTRLKAAAVTR